MLVDHTGGSGGERCDQRFHGAVDAHACAEACSGVIGGQEVRPKAQGKFHRQNRFRVLRQLDVPRQLTQRHFRWAGAVRSSCF